MRSCVRGIVAGISFFDLAEYAGLWSLALTSDKLWHGSGPDHLNEGLPQGLSFRRQSKRRGPPPG